MFAAVDEHRKQAFFRFSSPRITDAQWHYYLSTCERLGSQPGGSRPYLICISEPGAELPNARWRRRFAEVAAHVRTDCTFLLISSSPMARGIVTAVNWIRPFAFRHLVAATWAEGLVALEREDPTPGLRAQLEALRASQVAIPA